MNNTEDEPGLYITLKRYLILGWNDPFFGKGIGFLTTVFSTAMAVHGYWWFPPTCFLASAALLLGFGYLWDKKRGFHKETKFQWDRNEGAQKLLRRTKALMRYHGIPDEEGD